ncbi:MAG: MFS transporter, partial [Synergistaceae bacterium]
MILLVFLAYYGINCFINVYFIFGPLYEAFGATPAQVGMFLSIFYMAMTVCRPLGSLVMERVGIKKALMGSSLISAAAAAGIALSLALSMSQLLLFFRALSGISASVFIVATIAYQSMILDEKNRGVGFALFTTGSMLPLATVIPLSEWLLRQEYNYAYMWLPTAVALICFLISFKMKDAHGVAKKEKAWGTYAELFKIKGVPTLY